MTGMLQRMRDALEAGRRAAAEEKRRKDFVLTDLDLMVATGLPPARLESALDELQRAGFMEAADEPGSYRLTPMTAANAGMIQRLIDEELERRGDEANG